MQICHECGHHGYNIGRYCCPNCGERNIWGWHTIVARPIYRFLRDIKWESRDRIIISTNEDALALISKK